jgi:acyl carrier protein
MGLDTVEIVMAVEEAFGIEIPDQPASEILTVRDLIEYVYANVKHADQQVCLTQRAFHRLRKVARDEIGIPRYAIRPKTRWETIVPMESRRAHWKNIRDAIGVETSFDLERHPQTKRFIAIITTLTGVSVFTSGLSLTDPGTAFITGLAASIGALWILLRQTAHLRLYFTPGLTVGRTAEFMAGHNARSLKTTQGWTHANVRTVVRQILIDHLGVEPNFSDDARIIDDLGAD